MQLTSILLYQSLKEQFPIADCRLLSKDQPLARPYFYEKGQTLTGSHIYLTEAILDLDLFSSLPQDVVLIICQKNPASVLPAGRFSCILLSCDTSVIHVFNCIQSIFDYYEQWEQQLIHVCHTDGSLEDLLELSLPVFKNPLWISDTNFSLAAEAGLKEAAEEYEIFTKPEMRIDYMNAFHQDEACRIPKDSRVPVLFPAYITGHRSLNLNLFLDGRQEYYLSMLEWNSPVTEADSYLLTVLAQHAEYLLHRIHSESSSRSNTLQSTFQSILSDRTADYMGISRILASVGWLPEHLYLCVLLQPNLSGGASLGAKTICNYMETEFSSCCCLVFQENAVAFFNLTLMNTEPEDLHSKLAYFIRDSFLKAGYSRSMKGHMNLRRQYLQARTALTLGCEIHPELWIHHFSRIALPYILRQASKVLPGPMLCHEKLLDLQESDKVQNTEYMKTLKTYLDHNLNTVQSAKSLYIHRSTFLYRLERIKAILETDLEDPDELFYLNLSFRLLELNR